MFVYVYLKKFSSQEDPDAGLSVGQRKRVKLSSSTKGECKENVIDLYQPCDLSV